MLKRTKGRLLLTLLVITGLAGTLKNTSLNKQERKTAVVHLKDTRADFLQSVNELTPSQLLFRKAAGAPNIKECIYQLALSEKRYWDMFENAMKEPATPEKRSYVTLADEDVIRITEDLSQPLESPYAPTTKARWKNADQAVAAFKATRTEHLKYTKTTTEDLRNRVFQMPFGMIDGYQFILFISACSNRHIREINAIKEDPAFPER